MTTEIETVEEAKAAGYKIIGEWGDHLHHYHCGFLAAPAASAKRVKRMYERDEIGDGPTLCEFYRETGCIWVRWQSAATRDW